MRDGLSYRSGTWTFICRRAASFSSVVGLLLLFCSGYYGVSLRRSRAVFAAWRDKKAQSHSWPSQHEHFGLGFQVKGKQLWDKKVWLDFSSHRVFPLYFTVVFLVASETQYILKTLAIAGCLKVDWLTCEAVWWTRVAVSVFVFHYK